MPDDDADALASACAAAFISADYNGAKDLLQKIKASPGRENGA